MTSADSRTASAADYHLAPPALADYLTRPEWHARAACIGMHPSLFFDTGRNINPAKAVCNRCPVRAECLQWALENPEMSRQGVWGGVGERARRKLRRALVAFANT